MHAKFNQTAYSIRINYGIKFVISTSNINPYALLNGNTVCPLPPNLTCTTNNCRIVSECNGNHHKSDVRLLNALPSSNSFYTMGIVGHALCRYTTSHSKSGGKSAPLGKQSLVTNDYNNTSLHILMQRELSNNLGAYDTCTQSACVMGPSPQWGVWCDSCAGQIWYRR